MCDTEAEKKVESVEGDEKEIECLVNRIRRKESRKQGKKEGRRCGR